MFGVKRRNRERRLKRIRVFNGIHRVIDHLISTQSEKGLCILTVVFEHNIRDSSLYDYVMSQKPRRFGKNRHYYREVNTSDGSYWWWDRDDIAIRIEFLKYLLLRDFKDINKQ